jgi:uncharacterized protein
MELVRGERAVFLEDSASLVISDLHIGFEIELGRNGIFVPSQGPIFLKTISALAQRLKAKRIVLLGDVKHAFVDPTYSEEDKVVDFLEGLAATGKRIEIVPGNHDGDLKNVVPSKIKFHPSSGAVIGKTALAHGHAWPDGKLLSCENLLLSHLHPNVAFVDSLGAFHKEPCFLAGGLLSEQLRFNYEKLKLPKKLPNLMIMPGWNSLLGGSIVQELDFATGFWKCVDRANLNVILTDGTIVGKLGEMKL